MSPDGNEGDGDRGSPSLQLEDVSSQDKDDITSSDPQWGSDESESVDNEPESQQSSPNETSPGVSFSDIGLSPSQTDAPIDTQTDPVPGTDYKMPYVIQRTGKSATEWDRPNNLRFQMFDETATMLKEVSEWVNDEVYPEVNVLKADIQQAAFLVGLANPEDIVEVLDAWGYGELAD